MPASGDSDYSWFWNEWFWFPSNRTHNWKSLVNKPGSDLYIPDLHDLHWSFVVGFLLVGIRYLLETLVVVPIGLKCGVSNKPSPKVQPNALLEKAWRDKRRLTHDTIQALAKQTDQTERQVERWFRKRKLVNAPSPMKKFRECSWHLIFYTTFFVYALIYLWQKPYFWKSMLCWENWPYQNVDSVMYWHYIVELGFYWSLVFTVCTDHRRKDFTEMVVHHFATIVLMYFSWVLNFVRVGTLVLAVHDAADTWLALAKMSIYCKNKNATDVFFGIFLVVWVLSRLVYYPYVVLYTTTVEPYEAGIMDVTFGAHWFFNFFLYLLLVLHIIWTYLIFRIVYRKICKGAVEDVRSDSEDEGVEDLGDESADENQKNGKEMKGETTGNGRQNGDTRHRKEWEGKVKGNGIFSNGSFGKVNKAKANGNVKLNGTPQ